jgi:hypothetical protein
VTDREYRSARERERETLNEETHRHYLGIILNAGLHELSRHERSLAFCSTGLRRRLDSFRRARHRTRIKTKKQLNGSQGGCVLIGMDEEQDPLLPLIEQIDQSDMYVVASPAERKDKNKMYVFVPLKISAVDRHANFSFRFVEHSPASSL